MVSQVVRREEGLIRESISVKINAEACRAFWQGRISARAQERREPPTPRWGSHQEAKERRQARWRETLQRSSTHRLGGRGN